MDSKKLLEDEHGFPVLRNFAMHHWTAVNSVLIEQWLQYQGDLCGLPHIASKSTVTVCVRESLVILHCLLGVVICFHLPSARISGVCHDL